MKQSVRSLSYDPFLSRIFSPCQSVYGSWFYVRENFETQGKLDQVENGGSHKFPVFYVGRSGNRLVVQGAQLDPPYFTLHRLIRNHFHLCLGIPALMFATNDERICDGWYFSFAVHFLPSSPGRFYSLHALCLLCDQFLPLPPSQPLSLSSSLPFLSSPSRLLSLLSVAFHFYVPLEIASSFLV